MKLYIVRHGIAIDREDPKCPSESERYLTEEGIAKTRVVARGVAALANADLLITSPYVRALQTAEIFAAALKYPKQKILQTEVLLPGTDPLVFYRELAHHKNRESVFCFGHAPHLDELLAAGLGLKKDITQLKKAGVAGLELHKISPPAATLLFLAPPKLFKKP